MKDSERELLLKALPEVLACPVSGRKVAREKCVGCERVIGRCSATMAHVPTRLLGPDPDEEAERQREERRERARAKAEASEELPKRRVPIALDAETEALLAGGKPGLRYPTREAAKKARDLAMDISALRKEVRAAAAEGDRERLDRAVGDLKRLSAVRDALREPAEEKAAAPVPTDDELREGVIRNKAPEPFKIGRATMTADTRDLEPGDEVQEVNPVPTPVLDEAAARDLFGAPVEPRLPVNEGPVSREVLVKFAGVWHGHVVRAFCDSIANQMFADSLARYRVRIEIERAGEEEGA